MDTSSSSPPPASPPPPADAPLCRFCFDTTPPLIEPCKCTGTQRFIHAECLRQWQHTLMLSGNLAQSATVCNVCKSKYTVSIPLWWRIRQITKFLVLVMTLMSTAFFPEFILGVFVMILLFAFGFPETLHDVKSIVTILFVVIVPVLAMLRSQGLRPTIHVDEDGVPRLVLVRTGTYVDGLRAGMILLHDGAGGGIFHHSVVLLTRYSREEGAMGYILNHLEPQLIRPPQAASIGIGGPVSIGSHVGIIHNVSDITGAIPAMEGIYYGGRLEEIMTKDPGATVRMFAGYAGWSPRQLDGEVRSNSWSVYNATRQAVFSVPLENLHAWVKDNLEIVRLV